ncbi:MAG: F0F1 ATP synthase subunit A [Gemmatimonadetes bacterium]|nr:F0F1 ATP synthase subunit A [Gemmatimonadota bacterium]
MSALRSVVFALGLGLVASPLVAQEHAPEGAAAKVDIITPHITDGYHMELPWFAPPFYKEICLGRHVGEHGCEALWPDIHVGPLTLNLSPTKHVVFLFLAAFIVSALLIGAARAHRRHTHAVGRPKGFAAGVEAMVLYIRNEVILPNVGHHGNGFVPYLLTCFFFILTANLLGLIPYGSTSTGNIAVTFSLALMTFITTEVAGMRALGSGYLSTIFYWNKDLPMVMRVLMLIVVSPVELIGKFTKPIALAIRLFANMTAGHIVLLAFIGLIFTFNSYAVAVAPVAMAVALSLLELMVAFLQAFIFTLLSSVFIGLIRESHH